MNTTDVLRSGHETVLAAVEEFPSSGWEEPGACGEWSVKDILAHLASFEAALVDILRQLTDENAQTPTLDRFLNDYPAFNQREVEARRDQSPQAIREEYITHYEEAMRLLKAVPEQQRRQNGILAWYGEAYDLEDFLVYTYYGHKREHTAQVLAKRMTASQTS